MTTIIIGDPRCGDVFSGRPAQLARRHSPRARFSAARGAPRFSAARGALSAGILCLLLAALPCATAQADWTMFGHDLANSRNAGGDGPSVSAAKTLQQAWAFSSPHGDFTGTPAVAAGNLVAGTNLGSIYALDPATGRIRWSRDAGAPINGSAAIDPNAPGGATAFVPVAELGAPRLLALWLDSGRVRWQAVLTKQPGADVFSSPVYWRGRLYIGTSGPGNDEARARGSVVSLDEASGRIRWQTYTVPPGHDGGGVWSTPAIDPATGHLYVGTGNAYHAPAADTTDSIMALSASNGQILGHFQSTPGDVWELNAPAQGPDYDFGASPNLITGAGGAQLVGEGQKSGIYWALDRASLKPVWRTSVGPGSQADGGIGSSGFDGTRIYGSDSVDGQVFALGHDGSSRWNSYDPSTLHVSPVAIGGGVVWSADSGGFLVARDAGSGSVLNTLNLGAPTFGGISLDGGAVFVSVGTGPPSPVLPLPSDSTSQGDGSGSIIAFGDTSGLDSATGGFTLHLTSRAPESPTGATLHAVVHRGSPHAKPSALRTEVVDLPAGARFDGGAVPACRATDQQLQAEGPAACPVDSRVGGGTLQVMMGTPADPETADVAIFNVGNGTVEVVTAPGTGRTLALDRGTFTAPNELTNHPPTAPGGPPDFKAAVSRADFTYNLIRGTRGRAFITTPGSCPASGYWTSRVRYSTADGRSYIATSPTPCLRPAKVRGHRPGDQYRRHHQRPHRHPGRRSLRRHPGRHSRRARRDDQP